MDQQQNQEIIVNKPLLDAFKAKCDGHVFADSVTVYCMRNHKSRESAASYYFKNFPFLSVYHRHNYMRLEHFDQCTPFYSIYEIQSIFSNN